jgi:diketogulonate reductase-like aldo/keto reductase
MNTGTAPRFFYGTAWKEDATEGLVLAALEAGFTAIDTANQRKHYFEKGAGDGLHRFLEKTGKKRSEIFLQTKFTFARGQDHRKPYDENDPFTKQVNDSFASSLEHLRTDYLDSYVLHGPYRNDGIGAEDLETWSAMESLAQARALGVSNISADQLKTLCRQVKKKPAFVQNRCYASREWDRDVRAICKAEGIRYQGFSLLTANREPLARPEVAALAKKYGKTIPQLIFRFCQQLDMITLTGTTNARHMKEDLQIGDFELTREEVTRLEEIAL